MPRQQRSDKSVSEIARRFVCAMEEHLGLSAAQLWHQLGYANPSTIHAVRNGKTLPDFVRLAKHKKLLRDAKGRAVNLHWVITGEGSPMLSIQPSSAHRVSESDKLDNDIIIFMRNLPPKKKAALIKFLLEFP